MTLTTHRITVNIPTYAVAPTGAPLLPALVAQLLSAAPLQPPEQHGNMGKPWTEERRRSHKGRTGTPRNHIPRGHE